MANNTDAIPVNARVDELNRLSEWAIEKHDAMVYAGTVFTAGTSYRLAEDAIQQSKDELLVELKDYIIGRLESFLSEAETATKSTKPDSSTHRD